MMRAQVLKCLVAGALCLGALPAVSLAQDQENIEQLRQENADLLARLKAAQDRKNELDTEKTKLQTRVSELEKQIQDHQERAATFAEQTYLLRAHFGAWESFMAAHPEWVLRWKLFLESPWIGPEPLPVFSREIPATSER